MITWQTKNYHKYKSTINYGTNKSKKFFFFLQWYFFIARSLKVLTLSTVYLVNWYMVKFSSSRWRFLKFGLSHEERNYSELLHFFSFFFFSFFVCFVFVVNTGASYIFRGITKETKGDERWVLVGGQTNIFIFFISRKSLKSSLTMLFGIGTKEENVV